MQNNTAPEWNPTYIYAGPIIGGMLGPALFKLEYGEAFFLIKDLCKLLDDKFAKTNNQFGEVHNNLEVVDNKFIETGKKLTAVDGKLNYVQIISDVVQEQAISTEKLRHGN